MQGHLEDFDEVLTELLQKDLVLKIDGAAYKAGKLILYKHGYFNFTMSIKSNRKNRMETVRLPYPLHIVRTDGGPVLFDYDPAKMFHTPEARKWYSKIKKPCPSMLAGTTLTLEIVQPTCTVS